MRTTYRAVAATGLVAMCATGMSVLGAGSALAAAPADIPLDSCTSTVQANPGDHVVVSAKTLLAPQMKDLGALPLVGPLLVGTLNPVLASLTLPPITVQQLPSGDLAPITGAQIAQQLVVAVPALAPAAGPLSDALGGSCTVSVVRTKTVTAEAPPPAPTTAVPGPSAAPPPPPPVAVPVPVPVRSPVVTSYGHVAPFSYSDLTSVPAGGPGFTVNVAPTMPPKSLTGSGLPTTLSQAPLAAPALPPQFGLLTAPTVPNPPSTQSPAVHPVMSEVTALPAGPDASTRVPAEAVLAALLLSLTTAALVRTWVLRRSAG